MSFEVKSATPLSLKIRIIDGATDILQAELVAACAPGPLKNALFAPAPNGDSWKELPYSEVLSVYTVQVGDGYGSTNLSFEYGDPEGHGELTEPVNYVSVQETISSDPGEILLEFRYIRP